MSANTFGTLFKCHTFGESHGSALGVVIDGCPAGVHFSMDILNRELDRRRPGRYPWTSDRKEQDKPEVLSGVFEGKTLGTPICILVHNKEMRPEDYEKIKKKPRMGHADDLWQEKFHHRDHRGGGRSSGRETVGRVLAGAVAKMTLKELCPAFHVMAFVRSIGSLHLEETELKEAEKLFSSNAFSETYPACLPHKKKSKEAIQMLMEAKNQGESLGALVEIWIKGLPKGLGQPVFHKLKSDLTGAFAGIGGSTGILIGAGMAAASSKGTNFHKNPKNYGGLRGGLSTGERLEIQVPFKPPSSLRDVALKGRHDPCIGPRAVVVLEAMTSLTVLDHLLWKRLDCV